jgi:AraC-like DNA-binding protein
MRAELVPLSAGTHIRGLRLRTAALAAVLGYPGTEIRDRTESLDALLAPAAASSVAEAVWVGRRPSALALEEPLDVRVRFAVGRLSSDPRVSVAGLASDVGLSARHLRRLLREHTGLGPGELVRVGRLQRFLARADRGARLYRAGSLGRVGSLGRAGSLGLARLAVQAGYADQPHLTRDVRALTGLTPRELLRERYPDAERAALR